MIRTHIHHLRTKPEHIRHKIVLGATISLCAIIFVFWIYSLEQRFDNSLALKTGPKPFTLFKESFSSMLDSAKNASTANTINVINQ